jgi:hypothetical protein
MADGTVATHSDSKMFAMARPSNRHSRVLDRAGNDRAELMLRVAAAF